MHEYRNTLEHMFVSGLHRGYSFDCLEITQPGTTDIRTGCRRERMRLAVTKGRAVTNDNAASRERGGTRRRKNLSEKQLAILDVISRSVSQR